MQSITICINYPNRWCVGELTTLSLTARGSAHTATCQCLADSSGCRGHVPPGGGGPGEGGARCSGPGSTPVT